MTNNEQLRALCLAATPGPYRYEHRGQQVFAESIGGCRLEKDWFMLADIRGWGHLQYLPDGAEKQDANGKYIAAMDPTTTLALLDEIEQLQHLHRKVETEWQDRYDATCERKDALLREALRALKYHSDQTRPIEQTFDMMDAIKMELSK